MVLDGRRSTQKEDSSQAEGFRSARHSPPTLVMPVMTGRLGISSHCANGNALAGQGVHPPMTARSTGSEEYLLEGATDSCHCGHALPQCGLGDPRRGSGRRATLRLFSLVLVSQTDPQRLPLGGASGPPIKGCRAATLRLWSERLVRRLQPRLLRWISHELISSVSPRSVARRRRRPRRCVRARRGAPAVVTFSEPTRIRRSSLKERGRSRSLVGPSSCPRPCGWARR